jgi:FkbM family methyltransferase
MPRHCGGATRLKRSGTGPGMESAMLDCFADSAFAGPPRNDTAGMRRAFIDLGANNGSTAFAYAQRNPECDIYCIEPARALISAINEKSFCAGRTFITMWAAAWTYDGIINLFGSGASEASTVVAGKVEVNGWPQIDYSQAERVPCFDFSAWLMRTFTLQDSVTVKMDIEGAEYDLLDKMIADRSLLLVSELICEWHYDRYPGISETRHNNIKRRVGEMTALRDWG